jgi:hypothetical protein
MRIPVIRNPVYTFGVIAAFLASACGSESGTGALNVLLEPEAAITEGLTPGSDAEDMKDGWSVSFAKYIVAVGDIRLERAGSSNERFGLSPVQVVDLKKLAAQGEILWKAPALKTGTWEIFYHTPTVKADSVRNATVTQADFDAMLAAQATYLVEGSLSKAGGVACPPVALVSSGDKVSSGVSAKGIPCYPAASMAFSWRVPAATVFGPCEVDGKAGFSVTDGGTSSIAITVHGDHLFFNGFPEGDEANTMRLGQWLADCDLDLDGTVTQNELSAIAPSALAELDDRYQLGGTPITPLSTMWDYVRAQLKTQGHFQGEGECPIDGTAPAAK